MDQKGLFEDNGDLCSYEDFMRMRSFPVKYKEFSSVIRAITSGIMELMKYHLVYQSVHVQVHDLVIGE